ncbi:MAG: sulfatase-like hydrolase/transferase [Thermoguttaceae bacterium]|jgi:choline-sulfatase|nr:sulfatase-like hydrolase/transferase [Thermoguttaceae bacterium]
MISRLLNRTIPMFLLFGLALFSDPAASRAQTAAKRPNILFLFADDQSSETLGAAGCVDIDTPNLDRLASLGTHLTHAYNMGSWSGAVCVPSRAMAVTGRSLWRVQPVHREMDAQREAGRLWPQLMNRAGYRTYFTGKWHVATDAAKTFDVARNIRGGMPKDTPEGYNRPLPGRPDPWSPSDPKFGGFWQGGKHWTEVTADDAVDFLGQAAADDRPFFMYIAFNAPHDPRQSPQEYVNRYPLDRIPVPKSFLPEYPYKNEIGCPPTLRDERLGPFPRTEHAVKVHRQEYYAIITHMDTQIGRILDALEKSGKRDNTWIFFTSDHGLAVGHHGLFGKQNMYDHSVRVPLLVVGPGVPAGKKIDSPVYLQDVMPTALELAGVPKPEHVDFHSLLPLVRGETDSHAYESIYGAYLGLQRAITHDGWKLIAYPKVPIVRLYHVAADPLEINDLAADPAQTERVKQLFARLLALQKEFDDPLDLREAFPEL